MSETADAPTFPTMAPDAEPLHGALETVIRHPRMTPAGKREVLACWASDAHSVEDAPALRRLDDGSVVALDEILQALKALDAAEARAPDERPAWRPHPRRRGWLLSRLRVARRRRDRDDDPPPCPARAAFPVRIVPADAVAA
jgi:hypothetical protein